MYPFFAEVKLTTEVMNLLIVNSDSRKVDKIPSRNLSVGHNYLLVFADLSGADLVWSSETWKPWKPEIFQVLSFVFQEPLKMQFIGTAAVREASSLPTKYVMCNKIYPRSINFSIYKLQCCSQGEMRLIKDFANNMTIKARRTAKAGICIFSASY